MKGQERRGEKERGEREEQEVREEGKGEEGGRKGGGRKGGRDRQWRKECCCHLWVVVQGCHCACHFCECGAYMLVAIAAGGGLLSVRECLCALIVVSVLKSSLVQFFTSK
jgi:hypothetical protein